MKFLRYDLPSFFAAEQTVVTVQATPDTLELGPQSCPVGVTARASSGIIGSKHGRQRDKLNNSTKIGCWLKSKRLVCVRGLLLPSWPFRCMQLEELKQTCKHHTEPSGSFPHDRHSTRPTLT